MLQLWLLLAVISGLKQQFSTEQNLTVAAKEFKIHEVRLYNPVCQTKETITVE